MVKQNKKESVVMNMERQIKLECKNCQKSLVVLNGNASELQYCSYCGCLLNTKEVDECPYPVYKKNSDGLEHVEAFNLDWTIETLCSNLGIESDSLAYDVNENGNICVYLQNDDEKPLIKFDLCRGYIYADQELVLDEHT